jgi:hypothetical protein
MSTLFAMMPTAFQQVGSYRPPRRRLARAQAGRRLGSKLQGGMSRSFRWALMRQRSTIGARHRRAAAAGRSGSSGFALRRATATRLPA